MAIDVHEWERIAASAYAAYRSSMGGSRAALPVWKALPVDTRIAWEAAVRHAYNLLNWNDDVALPGDIERAEKGWAGWKPG